MPETIIVNIAADGTTTVEAQGIRGQGCSLLTRAIEQALGQTTGDVKKAEYFQPQTQSQAATAKGGTR